MLNKTLIPLAFGQGLDTKRDKKQQIFGKLRKAENVVFETLESARKRNGYDKVLLQTINGVDVDSVEFLARFKNELLLFDQSKLYAYSEALQALQERGPAYSVFPTSFPAVQNSYDNSDVQFLLVDNLKIFAYRVADTNEIRYTVQDVITQTKIVSDALVSSSARAPRLANIGTKIFIFYGTSTNLTFKTFLTTNPTVLSTATIVDTDFVADGTIDVTTGINGIVVAYRTTTVGSRLKLQLIDSNGLIQGNLILTGQDCDRGLDLFIDSNNFLVASFATENNVKYAVLGSNLAGTVLAPTTIATAEAEDEVSVTGVQLTNGNYQFFISYVTPTVAERPANNLIRTVVANLTGTIINALSTVKKSVIAASKPFIINNIVHLLAFYNSAIQSTYFLIDSTGVVLAKIAPSLGPSDISALLPQVPLLSANKVLVASTYRSSFTAQNGEFKSLDGVLNTEIDFASIQKYSNAGLGNNLLIAGGVVQAYDGQTISESNFNVFPEKPSLIGLSAGAIPAGNYGYVAVYRWTDAQGQEHRSSPSENLEVVVPVGPDQQVDVRVNALYLTNKENVIIELYRTENAGTIYYLTSSITRNADALANGFIGINDNKTDLELISGRLLYTTGGVLENIAPPAAKIVATHTASQRIFLAGLENPNELQYSKITAANGAVEFNDALRIAVDPVGGPITALAAMDEKLVIFEQDATFFMSGTGPNNVGQQDTFTTPERISIDIGCIEPRSVVLVPQGLMFKSRKGIYLLSRALALEYVGAPVEAFNSLTISSAKVVAELNQVRFTTVNGDCLVYNYVYGFWGTFTNHRALSAEVLGNDYYYIRANNELFKENRQSFSDHGVPIKMRIELGWISFNILQGFSRLYKMLVLGDWKSNHNLLVKVGYDFNEAWTQQVLIEPEQGEFVSTSYGDDSPYGSGTPYGGLTTPYQPRVNFKQQKCQSVKLLIEDQQDVPGEGFNISQITFEVGGKSGLFKQAKGKKYATK
jgi:hypothetical protein